MSKGGSRVVRYSNFRLETDIYYYNVAAIGVTLLFLITCIISLLLSLRKKDKVYIPISSQNFNATPQKDYFVLIQKDLSVNYSNPGYKVAHLSREMGISENKVRILLKEGSGMTFTEYLNYVRIEEAKRLLLESDLAVSDIGYRTGFEYHQSFTRVFKKYSGISPSDFRTKYN